MQASLKIYIVLFTCFFLNISTDPDCIDCLEQDNKQKKIGEKIYLVIGDSQTGKSTFIKDATGENILIGQYGEGKSQTTKIQEYQSKKYLKGATFIDTPGIQRTDLQEKSRFKDQLQTYLNNKQFKILSGIILIESYMANTLSLPQYILFISEIFGQSVSESITIFITKKNLIADQKYCKKRKNSIIQNARYLGVTSKIIDIQTTYSVLPSISYEEQQINQIQGILANLKPIDISLIKQKNEKIVKRSLEIQQQGKKVHSVKQSCLISDGHGLQIFNNGKSHLDEVIVEYEQFSSLSQCKKIAEEEYHNIIKSQLLKQ